MKRGHLYVHKRSLATKTPQALRLGWRALITTAQELAAPEAYRPGAPASFHRAPIGERLLDFQHLLREARPELFPVEGASVALMTEGFLKVGRAFAGAASPELREILGGALGACAEALMDILDRARDAIAAEHTRRVMGERED